MKNTYFLIATLFFFSLSADAQVSLGANLFNLGSIPAKELGKEPMKHITNTVITLGTKTSKSYHVASYGIANNAIGTLHGIFLPNNFDVYGRYARGLADASNTFAVGIERMIPIANSESNNTNAFIFAEASTDLHGGNFVSVGLMLSTKFTVIKKRKT